MKMNLKLVRQKLEADLKQAVPARGFRDSIRIHQVADSLEITQQATEREVAMHNLNRDSALIRRLRSAIERVDGGAYGKCMQCEEEIAPNRLKAIPWAELCIHCQNTADRVGANIETVGSTRRDRAIAA